MSADALIASRELVGSTVTPPPFKRSAKAERAPNEQQNGAFGRPALAFLLISLPALWLGWMMYRFGVDTPWGDQWDSTRLLFEKMQAGRLGLADFFPFHNEHRIFFPRLLTFALGKLTHWNVRVEIFAIWALACVCSFNLWRVAQVTGWRNARARHWLLLGANVLLFTPIQWENLLWGFQIGFFLPLATMTACLWVALSLRRPYDFVGTMVLCLISTFSIASGFASWIFTAPLLLLWNGKTRARDEKVCWSVWAVVAGASIYFYFHGFVRPEEHPSPLLALKHPILALQFLFAYLGNPFGSGTAFDKANISQMAAGVLVLLLLGTIGYLWRHRRDRVLLAQALPWLSLTSIALVNGALTTLGRFGFGMSAAMQSRYISFAIMLPIGLLFLCALIFQHWQEGSPSALNTTRVTMGSVALGTAFTLLYLGAMFYAMPFWRGFQHERLTGKAVLQLVEIFEEPETMARYIHWSHWTLKSWAESMDRLGYLNPPLLRSRHVREIAGDSQGELMGELNQFVRHPNGELSASGWAILPGKNRVADSVLLTYDDAGEPIMFARVDVTYARPDVSERLRDRTYYPSGWTKSWKAEELPSRARRISAWAFDAEEGRAFLLGSATM